MIAPDSRSYPYLALARSLNVDYGRVLRLVDTMDRLEANGLMLIRALENGNDAFWLAVRDRRAAEMRRRKA